MGCALRHRAFGLIVTLAVACPVVAVLAGEPVSKPGLAKAAGAEASPEKFTADEIEHWSYQPLERPEPPAVGEVSWVRNPIDRFTLAELEAIELPHAPEADRIALIRRVTFDLTGLPPTPREVAAFLSDAWCDAYERLVDRLLASPRYGEWWAQHGWTLPITPTRTGSSSTPSGPTPGGIATGWCKRSTPTCLMTGSSPSSLPAMRFSRAMQKHLVQGAM